MDDNAPVSESDRLQIILDTLPTYIWVKDHEHRILRCNRAAAEASGLPVEEIVGKLTAEVYPVQAKSYEATDRELTQSHSPIRDRIETLTSVSGHERRMKISKYELPSEDGSPPRILVVGTDLTEIEKANLMLEAKTRELEQSNDDLDRFAYIASHDLKSPLRGIKHLADWIIEDLPSDPGPEVRSHIDMLKSRISKMESLLDDLLIYSRVGRQEFRPRPMRLIDWFGELTSFLSIPDEIDVMLLGDTEGVIQVTPMLETALRNLIGNAVKYGGDGGLVEVTGRLQDAGSVNETLASAKGIGGAAGVDSMTSDSSSFWHLMVRDRGIGIAEEYHKRIFEMFQRLDSREQGTGIGLALVRRIAEVVGGQVWVESSAGSGATFHFVWPNDPVAINR